MYDVIIVGCGVAGGYLASHLQGLNVLVLEKDKKVTLKDSGLVSSHFREFFPAHLVKSKIREMRVVSPSGIGFSLRSEEPFAFLLKREEFSSYLRKKAQKRAELRYEPATNVSYDTDGASVMTPSGEYKARVIVGCDGAASIVRKSLGIRLRTMAGVFARAKEALPQREISVYLNKYFSADSISWAIPHTNEYGLMTAIRPLESLAYFRKAMGFPEGVIRGSLMPRGLCKSFGYRTLLVGDSCGHAKPLSGGGVMFSLRAARHAAAAIKGAVENGKFDFSGYERAWKRELFAEMRLQLLAKRFYRKLTNRDIDEMFVKFGYHISNMHDFDYDRLSSIAWKLPKLAIIRYFLPKLSLLL